MSNKWTDEKNERRCKLIDKDIDGTITPTEELELEELERQVDAYLDEVAPLPINEARQVWAAIHKQVDEFYEKRRRSS